MSFRLQVNERSERINPILQVKQIPRLVRRYRGLDMTPERSRKQHTNGHEVVQRKYAQCAPPVEFTEIIRFPFCPKQAASNQESRQDEKEVHAHPTKPS